MKQMVLLIGLVTVFVFDSVAATRHWAGVGGSGVGDFEEPSNWTQGAVPGADDLVAVNNMNNEDFVVTLNSDVTNTKLSLMVPTPGYETLFVMNQHVWSVTDMVSSWHASGGRITFTNGTLRTQTGHFMPDSGALVTNLMLFMKEVTCEMTTASFRAGTASFEGGQLQVSDYISVGARGFPAATVKLDRGVQCNVTNSILIASDTGATGEFINVNGALTVEGPGNSLYAGQGGCGTMILNGGSIYISGVSFIGTDSSSVGHMKITGGSNTFGDTASGSTVNVGYEGKGSLLVGGGTNYVGGSASVGVGVSGVGEMTVTGGLWTIRRFLFVGESGLGTLKVQGGELKTTLIAAGRYPNATGTVNVSGGVLNVNGNVWLGGDAGSSGQLTLSGNGVLKTKSIMERDGSCLFSQAVFDGGTLQAAAAGTLIQPLDDVRLTGKGLVVDTAGYNVSVVPMLQDAEGAAGSLTKKGLGTLTLTGTRAATGSVSVLGGTLVAGNDDVAVSAGTSRIDATLSLTADKRLMVAAGAALAGTGSVARVTLADNAVFARSRTEAAIDPLNVSDCTANGHLRVALSGYALTNLVTSLPLLKVPTATFVKPISTSVTLDGVAVPAILVKYTQNNGATILSVKYNSGTVIIAQ